jgi:hypothetical protein
MIKFIFFNKKYQTHFSYVSEKYSMIKIYFLNKNIRHVYGTLFHDDMNGREEIETISVNG